MFSTIFHNDFYDISIHLCKLRKGSRRSESTSGALTLFQSERGLDQITDTRWIYFLAAIFKDMISSRFKLSNTPRNLYCSPSFRLAIEVGPSNCTFAPSQLQHLPLNSSLDLGQDQCLSAMLELTSVLYLTCFQTGQIL